MTRPLLKPATCAVCDAPGAHPAEGHMSPLCTACHAEWMASDERARAATARDDFVRRARAEREPRAKPTKRLEVDELVDSLEEDPWR